MNEMYQSKFFVAYPRNEESEVRSIISQIEDRLKISYDLWSYSNVEDECDYFEKHVSPAIENADFVLIFVSKDAITDFIVTETCRFCSNLNKRIMAIKVGSERVRSKEWNFRSDILDYTKESEKISIIEQIHGWLGLRKTGDVYGANVTIKANIPCTVCRGNEVLGQAQQNGPMNCVLAQGSNYLTFKFGNEWNHYEYYIPNNNCNVEFNASLTGTKTLSKIGYLPVSTDINKSLDEDWNWDVTDRNDFVLVSSSQDEKKRNVIFNSYNQHYLNGRKSYPKFVPEEINHSSGLEVAAWIVSIAIGIFGAVFSGIIAICIFYWLRKKNDKRIIRSNERKKEELISDTDNYNYNLWNKTNTAMNEALSERNLAEASLINLGTPR